MTPALEEYEISKAAAGIISGNTMIFGGDMVFNKVL
jgi:hypothetical protein